MENENGRWYLMVWTCALKQLLDWPEDRTLSWAAQYDSRMEEGGLFYHEPPSFYIVSMFIPDSVRQCLQEPVPWEIFNKIHGVLLDIDDIPDVDIDWSAMKAGIERILNRYGESLSRIASLPPEHFNDLRFHM